jgi:diaminohydroxyphosphoribosylaminopyrimidine deaminase / 5-amino-6-(5-phosphoribosylamino)uracil reductase
MRVLAEMKIASIMIEGGATLLEQALSAGVADRLYLVVAPKIFGGRDALPAVAGLGADAVADAWQVKDMKIRRLGPDLLIEGKL